MSDHPDLSPVEQVLQRELLAYAGAVDGPFDPHAVARTAVGTRRRPSIGPIRIRWADSRLLLVAVVALLAALIAVTAFVGSRLPVDNRSPVSNPLAGIDPCQVLYRAIEGPSSSGPAPAPTYGYSRGYDPRGQDGYAATWGARSCVYLRGPDWDTSYVFPHLFIRSSPTTTAEAEAILGLGGPWHVTGPFQEAWYGEPGIWRAARPDSGWSAVAISVEPYFFVVTGPIVEDGWTEDFHRRAADVVAVAVARELGIGEIALDAP